MKDLIQKKWFKYILYSAIYWIFAVYLLYRMGSNGYIAIGGWDGITETYPVMVYTRRILLEFWENLLQGQISFPMVDWRLGMGDDTLVALNWHGFGDPMYLLSVFVSESAMPYFFSFMLYLKIYLAGLAFMAFVAYLLPGKSNEAYVIGALTYCFTGYTVQSNMHIMFTHAMYCIPLLFLGAEYAMEKKNKWIIVFTTFLFALCGFFYLYIGSIALAVYTIYRMVRRKTALKNAFLVIRDMLAAYLTGLCLAGVVFIPNVIGFLGSNRSIAKNEFSCFFTLADMKTFFLNCFLPQYENYQVLSMVIIGVLSVFWIILAKGKKQEKCNVCIMLLMVFTPLISNIMSGFGENYDRWEVVITLYFAFLTVLMWDELGELSWIQRIGTVLLYLVIGIYAKAHDMLDHERFSVTIVSYGIVVALVCLILPMCRKMNWKKAGMYLTFWIMIFVICRTWRMTYRDKEITWVTEENVVEELLENSDSSGFYRIDNERVFGEPRNAQNIALVWDYYGLAEYFSIENASYTKALSKWDVSTEAFLSHVNLGVDQRTVLESLCGVKYLILREGSEEILPYGFDYVKQTQDGKWCLYENQNVLPIVYTYDKVYDIAKYEDLNGFEKQQIMMQAAAIEDYAGSMEKGDIKEALRTEAYEVTALTNIDYEDGVYKVHAGGQMQITWKPRENSEHYLLLSQVDINSSLNFVLSDTRTKYTTIDKYCDDGNIGVNLGLSEEYSKTLLINFTEETTIAEEQIVIYSYDLVHFKEQTDMLREDSLQNLAVGRNQIAFTMDADENKIACIAVPYSEGWCAYVDGEKVPVYRMNDMFMGLEIAKGPHSVELRYVTPGIRLGAGLGLGALLLLTAYCFTKKKRIR